MQLTDETITFGKYVGRSLNEVVRDRKYCYWLLNEPWFKQNYEYLYNRIEEYKPDKYFFSQFDENPTPDNFVNTYKYFNLKEISEISLNLSDIDRKCYIYYRNLIMEFRKQIVDNNTFDIKISGKWLIVFEKETGITRKELKEFLEAHELLNIPWIIEAIKKMGNIEYKGAKSFIIAKNNSLKQEAFWEDLLKSKYGEDLSVQFKFDKCKFDFLHINNRVIYECKLSFKDFSNEQFKKYTKTLQKYDIIYLIGYDCIVNFKNKCIYTLDEFKYLLKKTSSLEFDEIIEHFNLVKVDNLSEYI